MRISFYAVFDTVAGWMGVLGSVNGLRRTTLPQRWEKTAHACSEIA